MINDTIRFGTGVMYSHTNLMMDGMRAMMERTLSIESESYEFERFEFYSIDKFK